MTEFETKYLPSEWLDEVVPAAQEDPSLFVFYNEKLGWHMRDPDEPDAEEGDSWLTRLNIGQVVRFSANRVYGDFTLNIATDGSYDVVGDIPADANCFRLFRDNDTINDSISSLIENCELGEGSHDIDAYWWSNEDYLFRLEFRDEKGVFVACGVEQ